MADQTDVENSLVGLIAGFIYPNGTSQAPAQGIPAQVIPGWPVPAQVDTLMTAGTAAVWVYARPEVKETTRYPMVWGSATIVPPTITATVSGDIVTIGGAMPLPFTAHNVFILLVGQAFGYAVQATDTLNTIASALATLIAAAFPGTTSSGSVITINSGAIPTARVGTTGTTVEEVGRFEQAFQICIATPTPAGRTAIASSILPQLMAISFITLPDGSAARLRARAPVDVDSGQKSNVFRRDLKVTVEYAVTQSQTTATVEAVNVSYPGSNIPSRSY
jgi:hypothetical protein